MENNIDEQIICALNNIAYYNCHFEELKHIIEYIKSNKDELVIVLPDFLMDYHCDHFVRTLWSIAVILYGDYGSSPRTGFIYTENKEKALEFFEDILMEEE